MADDVLKKLVVEIRTDQKKLREELNTLKGKMEYEGRKVGAKFGTAMGSAMTKVLVAGGGLIALQKFTSFIKTSINLYKRQESAEKKLSIAYGRNIKTLTDYASALQRKTAYGDEDIIESQALIAAFVKEEDAIKKATKATLELAAAKGMQLKVAADLISKTLGSTTNALSRYGITVEGAVGSHERLSSLISEIDKKFGGQAEGTLLTHEGRVQALSNAWGDFKEVLGKKVVPVLEDVLSGMKSIGEWLGIFEKGFKSISIGSVIEDMKSQNAPIAEIREMQKLQLKEIERQIQGSFSGVDLRGKVINKDLVRAYIKEAQKGLNESLSQELYFKTQINLPNANEEFKKTAYEHLKAQEASTLEYRKQISEYSDLIQLLEQGKKIQDEIAGISSGVTSGILRSRADEGYNSFGSSTLADKVAFERMQEIIKASQKRSRASSGYSDSVHDAIGFNQSVASEALEEQKDLWVDIQQAQSTAMGNLASQWASQIQLISNANSMLEQFLNTLVQVGLQQVAISAIGSFSGGGILGEIGSLFKGNSGTGQIVSAIQANTAVLEGKNMSPSVNVSLDGVATVKSLQKKQAYLSKSGRSGF